MGKVRVKVGASGSGKRRITRTEVDTGPLRRSIRRTQKNGGAFAISRVPMKSQKMKTATKGILNGSDIVCDQKVPVIRVQRCRLRKNKTVPCEELDKIMEDGKPIVLLTNCDHLLVEYFKERARNSVVTVRLDRLSQKQLRSISQDVVEVKGKTSHPNPLPSPSVCKPAISSQSASTLPTGPVANDQAESPAAIPTPSLLLPASETAPLSNDQPSIQCGPAASDQTESPEATASTSPPVCNPVPHPVDQSSLPTGIVANDQAGSSAAVPTPTPLLPACESIPILIDDVNEPSIQTGPVTNDQVGSSEATTISSTSFSVCKPIVIDAATIQTDQQDHTDSSSQPGTTCEAAFINISDNPDELKMDYEGNKVISTGSSEATPTSPSSLTECEPILIDESSVPTGPFAMNQAEGSAAILTTSTSLPGCEPVPLPISQPSIQTDPVTSDHSGSSEATPSTSPPACESILNDDSSIPANQSDHVESCLQASSTGKVEFISKSDDNDDHKMDYEVISAGSSEPTPTPSSSLTDSEPILIDESSFPTEPVANDQAGNSEATPSTSLPACEPIMIDDSLVPTTQSDHLENFPQAGSTSEIESVNKSGDNDDDIKMDCEEISAGSSEATITPSSSLTECEPILIDESSFPTEPVANDQAGSSEATPSTSPPDREPILIDHSPVSTNQSDHVESFPQAGSTGEVEYVDVSDDDDDFKMRHEGNSAPQQSNSTSPPQHPQQEYPSMPHQHQQYHEMPSQQKQYRPKYRAVNPSQYKEDDLMNSPYYTQFFLDDNYPPYLAETTDHVTLTVPVSLFVRRPVRVICKKSDQYTEEEIMLALNNELTYCQENQMNQEQTINLPSREELNLENTTPH